MPRPPDPRWLAAIGPERAAFLTESKKVAPIRATAREMAEEGACCSCHLYPPCAFCVSLSEAEADVYANAGMNGLWVFWAQERTDDE